MRFFRVDTFTTTETVVAADRCGLTSIRPHPTPSRLNSGRHPTARNERGSQVDGIQQKDEQKEVRKDAA